MKISEYLDANGMKLSPSSKAAKLIKEDKSEAKIAIAMQSTKAYKEDKQLRSLCEDIIENAAQVQEREAKKEETKSYSDKPAEPRYRR